MTLDQDGGVHPARLGGLLLLLPRVHASPGSCVGEGDVKAAILGMVPYGPDLWVNEWGRGRTRKKHKHTNQNKKHIDFTAACC